MKAKHGGSRNDCRNTAGKGVLGTFKSYLDRNRLGELLVVKGFITPQELKSALHTQKKTSQPLGQIFLKHSVISKHQLAMILGRQLALKVLAAGLFFTLSLTGNGSKKAHADALKDIPGRIAISKPLTKQFTNAAVYPALFGSEEKRSSNLNPFTKWTGMFSRFEDELKKGSNHAAIKNWQNDLSAFKGLSLKRMAKKVNDFVNEADYILDKNNWGKSDYWATPVEFLSRGGDCEDFAITKYTALRMLGVPEEHLRIAIVHDNLKNIPHAVLVVYTDEGTFILDNQNKRMMSGDRPGRYRPIFSINRQARWLHTAPDSATVIASAQ